MSTIHAQIPPPHWETRHDSGMGEEGGQGPIAEQVKQLTRIDIDQDWSQDGETTLPSPVLSFRSRHLLLGC